MVPNRKQIQIVVVAEGTGSSVMEESSRSMSSSPSPRCLLLLPRGCRWWFAGAQLCLGKFRPTSSEVKSRIRAFLNFSSWKKTSDYKCIDA